MGYPLTQSAWRRGWNDTKTVWTSWQFFILDAVVAVVIGSVFQWYWGLGIVLFGMLCAWLAVTITAPVRQRNEARHLLSKIPSKKKVIADKLAEFWLDGENLRASIIQHKLQENALDSYNRWGNTIKDYFNANPSELGQAKLLRFIPSIDELRVPIPDEFNFDRETSYAYIMLSLQTDKLKSLIEEFLE